MRQLSRSRASSRKRRLTLTVDRLEVREVLSSVSGLVAQPMFNLGSMATYNSPPSGAYTPAQIRSAYGFNNISFGSVQGDGTGQTIAIVDAYSDPKIQADLNTFDAQFGLPNTTVTQVNENGGTSLPGTDSSGGWELEEALDVEWAHAMAPGAKIVLVAAGSANDTDLLQAVQTASNMANVVSMSWGGGEFSYEASYNSDFSKSGVAFVASSGDNGAPVSWPAVSPNVLAVGGTSLSLGSGNSYRSESGWSGSGGGPSAYVSQPSYQQGVVTQTSARANPDVSYNADPYTGFAVYDTYKYSGRSYGWVQLGGTSAGAPQWAALLAIADQGRALNGQSALDSSNPQGVQTTLYQNAGSGIFHDVTSGYSTGYPYYSAGRGYDYVTGLGTPKADQVVQALAGPTSTNPPVSSDTLTVQAPSGGMAGTQFAVSVYALNSQGMIDPGYTGTVRLSSSDVQAGLPTNYMFSAADQGMHTFYVTLKTAGTQSVSVTDTASGQSVSASGIVVSPGAVSQFVISGLGSSATVGEGLNFSVTAKDAYGNVVTDYNGTVQFSSSDLAAGLPGTYQFTAADQGTYGFSVSFGTAGTQTVTVRDSNLGVQVTSGGVVVSPAAPTSLSATAASDNQINLSWTASPGATGYAIQRSANNGTTWTSVTTTSGTTYQDTGLTAGTTYTYRVRALGGNGSGYSNPASAKTTGTAPVSATDSLWSNSYVPNENAYASGYYEVGLKFSSDVAGTVTGVKFYEQTWMYGYNHVGHLWSSSGQLLATVTFSGETGVGWQQATFSNPVSISANTTYVVSFSTGGGYFGISTGSIGSTGYSNGPLHALPNSWSNGGNGVYGYSGSFPSYNGNGMNFWVDVMFSPSVSSAVQPAVSTVSPAAQGVTVVPATANDANTNSTDNDTGTGSQTGTSNTSSTTHGTWSHDRTVPQTTGYGWSGRNRYGYGNW